MAMRQGATMARRGRVWAASGSAQAPPKPEVVPQKDVRVLKLLDGTVALRGNVQERFKFEVEYGKKRGTTDNAYIVRGENASALIDVPDRAFAEAFIQAVEKEIGVDKLQFLIVGHFSPKRMDTLMALLKARSKSAPPLQIICSNPSKQLLLKSLERKMADFFTERATLKAVRTNDPLDLGSGRLLTFITTPTPRWPDALCTYDNQTGLLFSNKFFGCHVCDQEGQAGVDTGGWDEYGEDWNYYYECLVKPVAKQATVVLEKLNLAVKNERPALYKEAESSGMEGLEASLRKASFDPPGLTVAVAKDRAVESLVLEGGKFNLSMLAEGKAKPVVKELSKPYRPQEDRTTTIETEVSENNQCVYLKDAVSYVECTVKNRLEAGDHYILYATVDDGKLLDDGATTAVHFRRSGSNY
eukprot:jgi/Pico_ML_1/55728/g1377.t1